MRRRRARTAAGLRLLLLCLDLRECENHVSSLQASQSAICNSRMPHVAKAAQPMAGASTRLNVSLQHLHHVKAIHVILASIMWPTQWSWESLFPPWVAFTTQVPGNCTAKCATQVERGHSDHDTQRWDHGHSGAASEDAHEKWCCWEHHSVASLSTLPELGGITSDNFQNPPDIVVSFQDCLVFRSRSSRPSVTGVLQAAPGLIAVVVCGVPTWLSFSHSNCCTEVYLPNNQNEEQELCEIVKIPCWILCSCATIAGTKFQYQYLHFVLRFLSKISWNFRDVCMIYLSPCMYAKLQDCSPSLHVCWRFFCR